MEASESEEIEEDKSAEETKEDADDSFSNQKRKSKWKILNYKYRWEVTYDE